MIDFLKRYKIRLEVLTPVFIGSGQEINKKEYMYYRNSQEAWIPNKGKLLRSIMNHQLTDQYEEYMLSGTEPLLNWLKSVDYTDKELQSLCDYHLDCSYALENLNRPIGIEEFMKDAYGLPYIPGSSLKGAIRSVLLGSRILADPKRYDEVRESASNRNDMFNGKPNRKYLVPEGRQVEEVSFYTLRNMERISDARNDELRGLIISDSKPLKVDDLTLSQKTDLRLDGKKNALNTLRESLKPGTVVEFDMTIDTTVLNLSAQEIEQALKDVFKFYQNVYVKKFTAVSDGDKANLYLGGGTGYGTKTITYELLEDWNRMQVVSKLMTIKFPKHNHRGDAKKGASPHSLKCTNYGGKLCEMGKCHMVIEEI